MEAVYFFSVIFAFWFMNNTF